MNAQNGKKYDLEERTSKFAKNVREFLRSIGSQASSTEDGKQLIRSSGSIGANYIEANEALSKKECIYRLHICRKEAKESAFWLDMFVVSSRLEPRREALAREARELMKIVNAIIEKSK